VILMRRWHQHLAQPTADGPPNWNNALYVA
jgi:hypothetical protein